MTDAVSHSIAPLVMSSSQHVGSSQFIIPSSQNDSIMAEPPQYDDQRCSSMQFGLDLPGKIEFQEQRQHANQPSLSQLAFDDGTASLRNSQAFNSQMLNDSQQLHEFTRDMSGIDHQSALSHPHVPFGPASFPAINFVLPSGPIDPQMMSLLAMMAQNQTGSQRMPEASPLPNLPHPSLMKPEHKDSRAIRRGPMDEMRQLLRILVKLFPQAPLNTSAPDSEGGASGGGNRLSERQIREFLEFLGDAPEPEWGLPEGWGTYISELFTWATGKRITREQAAVCARRKQGKSWEVVPHELAKLGVYCWTWPVPLTLDGIKEANDAAAEENKDLVTNPRGAMKVVMHRRPPLPRASSNPLSSPGGGRDEEAGDELGIAKLLGEMRNSQSQLPGPAEMSNNGQGMIDPIEASAKRHKNHHGGVTLSPAADLSPPAVSPAGGNNVNPVGGEQTQPASVAKPTLDVTTIDYSSLSAIDCWNLATKLINIAGSGQGDSNALETGERIRAIGTTIQAIGLEARSALSDLLPEIPKGYHEILVSLKTLEEKWLALSKRTK